MRKSYLLLLILQLMMSVVADAQYLVPEQGVDTIRVCSGTVTDRVNQLLPIITPRNGSLTIFPATPGYRIKLTFVSFQTDDIDNYLEIINGTASSQLAIGRYSGNDSPGVLFSKDSSGALTLRFVTPYPNYTKGFVAIIECISTEQLPDLTASKAEINLLPNFPYEENGFYFNITNKNEDVAQPDYSCYFSLDAFLDATDSLIQYESVNLIESNKSDLYDIGQYWAPDAPGQHFTLLKIDPFDSIHESNEHNNLLAIPYLVDSSFIDLAASQIITNTAILRGNMNQIAFDILNLGNKNIAHFSTGLFFSNDSVLDSNDIKISNFPVTNFSISTLPTHLNQNGNVCFPANLPLGIHFIFFVMDDSLIITESNETNNIIRRTVSIIDGANDLYIKKAGTEKNESAPGGFAKVYFETYQKGQVNVQWMGFFLSSDTILDQGDSLLYKIAFGSAQPNATLPVYFPPGTPIGNFYIIIKIDLYNYIIESNENNNTFFVPVKLISPSIDLQYEKKTWNTYGNGQMNFIANNAIVFSCDIYNAGNTRSNSASVGFYLSSDSLLDSLDNPIDHKLMPAIDPSGITTVMSGGNWLIPNWLAPGKYFILTVLDEYQQITESDEVNNVHSDIIYIAPSLFDYKFQAGFIQPSNIIEDGDTVQAIFRIMKNGIFNTSTSAVTNYYLSKISTLDSNAVLLSSININPNLSTSLHIPSGILEGRYYIICYFDANNQIQETDETNNVGYIPISVYNGTPIYDSILNNIHDTLTDCFTTIQNTLLPIKGTLTLLPSQVGKKISLDLYSYIGSGTTVSIYDGQDTLAPKINDWNSTNSPLLSTIYANNVKGAITLNAKKLYPNYSSSIKAVASCIDSVLPLADLNFIKDLIYTNTSYIKSGSPINIKLSIGNSGGQKATSGNIGFYLSNNDILDASDIFMDSITVGEIYGGTYREYIKTITLSLTNTGQYYVICLADFNDSIHESKENNNSSSFRINIQNELPDLFLRDAIFQQYPLNSNPYEINCYASLRNLNGLCEDTVFVGVYISHDTLFDSSDVLLKQIWINDFRTTFNSTLPNLNLSCEIPMSLSLGHYTLFLIADNKNRNTESNENNNFLSLPIVLTSRISDISLETFDINFIRNIYGSYCQIRNLFVADLGNWQNPNYSSTAFYLSLDTIIDSSDSILIENPGSYVTIMLHASPGKYYIIGKVDAQNTVAELNENNNTLCIPFTLTDMNYDIKLESSTIFRKSIIAGNKLNGQIHFSNQGGTAIDKAQFGVFLSSDTLLDSTDYLLSSLYNWSYSQWFNFQASIDSTVLPGYYYILVKADDNDSIVELDESNNQLRFPLTIYSRIIDLTFNSYSISNNNIAAGFTMIANAEVYNHGNCSLSNTKVGYYLSSDSLFDITDIFLGTSHQSKLDAGFLSYKNTLISIPPSTPNGNYFLLFFVDDSNQVIENNENNNIRALPITVGTAYTDLTLQSPVLSNVWLSAGDIAMAKIQVSNSGNIYCSLSNLAYYFSKDTVLDSLDISLGSSTGSALAANGSELRQQSLAIPASADTGNYFILFQVDQTNLVIESNEGNNLRYIPINISLVGIKEQIPVEVITISPNPFRSKIKIEFGNNFKKSITVFDISGRIIYQKKEILESSSEISTANWAEGIYFMDIKQDQKEFRKKLIKLN